MNFSTNLRSGVESLIISWISGSVSLSPMEVLVTNQALACYKQVIGQYK